MGDILSLTIPFFGIILLGAFSRSSGFFDEQAGRILARFAFFVVLPAFMFVSITSAPVSEVANPHFILRYEAVTIIIFALGIVFATRILGLSGRSSGIFALNATYPNYGYIGVPLAILAFGEGAVVPMSLILVCDSIMLLLLTAIFTRDKGSGDLSSALVQMLRSMSRNPLLLSVLTGFIFSACGLTLPQMPIFFLDMLAGAAAPTALFALGITLVGQPIRSARAELGTITILKLVIHPLLMAAVMLTMPGLDMLWIQTAILFACLPVAANVFALSEFYHAYSGRTATSIMLTTLIASVSVPATLYALTMLGKAG
ncbi:MAG: AEC family transporter [Alphaproteobacteria bacterium]|tara:strand:- start:492 stop:1436 length:945 start_codon:yes stop_codon:yes gene_type:complete